MSDPLNTTPDLDADYQTHRNQVAEGDVIAQARARMQAREKPAAGSGGGLSTENQEMKPQKANPLTLGEYANPNPFVGARGGAMDGVKAVTVDVIGGIVEAPRQIVGGISDAAHNALMGFSHLGDWLNENVADLRVSVPATGVKQFDDLLADPLKAAAGDKNEVDPAKTATGGLVRDTSRFLAGFLPLFRGLKVVGVGAAPARGALAGAGDAVVQDPYEKGLADLVQKYPALANPVTEFLSAAPDDPEVLARFKKSLEGVGLGVLAEGVVRAVGAIARARRAGGAPAEAADALAQQRSVYGELGDRDFLILGDPQAPLFKVASDAPGVGGAAGRVGANKMRKGEDAVGAGGDRRAQEIDAELAQLKKDLPGIEAKARAGTDVERRRAGALAEDKRAKIATLEAERAGLKIPGGAPLGVPDEVAANALAKSGAAGGKDVFINWARINTADDVKSVLGQMADAFAPSIDKARRGVQSNEATKELADKLEMTVPELLARRQGQPFNAEQAVAARGLWAASAEKLMEVARKAAAPNAGPVDQFNFRRMMAVHYAIQAEVIGARTETARALQAWSIPVGGGVEKARAVQQLLDGMGGMEFSRATAQRLSMLEAAGVAKGEIDKAVRKTWAASTMAAVQEVWINALLSSPKTHIVNTTSNLAVAFQLIGERAVGSRLSQIMGGEIAAHEATAMAYGAVTAIKDAWRLAAKALRSGQTGASLGKIDLPREHAVQGDWLRQSGHDGMAAAVDFIGAAARVPSRLLGAEDEFFKTIAYRAEVHAHSLRQATQEGLQGPDLYRRMAEIAANPPEHIRLAAADAALYATFSNATGDLGKALMMLREKVPVTAFIMPFIRTPVNIARFSFERSPMAPLVGQWRQDIKAGGARGELALARMATGTTVMLIAADYADRGLITGSGPDDAGEREALRRQGWQPNSIRLGDRWVSYNRLDPFGMTMGFAADLAELVKRKEIEPDELDEVNEMVAAGIAAVSRTVVGKTYMQGLANFIEAMEEPERNASAFIDKWLGSFVPAVVAAGEGAIDPTARETMKLGDSALARIPILSARLTPRRDLWGEPISPSSGFGGVYDALSPVQVSRIKESPIDAEMTRLNMNVQRIAKRTTFDGVQVNLRDWPEVYDAYVALAGNGLKHPAWELGAKDLLDAIVAGKHDLSPVYALRQDTSKPADGGKAGFISATIGEFRQMAQREILADPRFRRFAAEIEEAKAEVQQKRMPVEAASTPAAPASSSAAPVRGGAPPAGQKQTSTPVLR